MLELALVEALVVAPKPDEVWSASTPPHQSVGLDDLARGGRPTDARFGGTSQRPQVQIPLGSRAKQAMAHRVGFSLPVGQEGAGQVVAPDQMFTS